MTAKGHTVLAMSAAMLVEREWLDLDAAMIPMYYGIILFACLFPDIDEPKSRIGRRLPLSHFLKFMGLEHRAWTHRLILPLIIAAAALLADDAYIRLWILSFAFGVLLHDVGDLLTKGGIDGFFWPLFPEAKAGLLPRSLRFYTRSIHEYALIVLMVALDAFYWRDTIPFIQGGPFS
ncbi:metal-dependent hydrolase [Thiomicrolovo sp. ZZH C-3]